MLAEFKGQNGKIMVFDDHIAISRATFGGFVSQGGSSGDRKFFFSDITTVEYKKPSFFANGYFKVIVPGTSETNAKVGLLSSSNESMKDQNTVVLRAFTSKVGDEMEKVYELIMKKLTEAKKNKQGTPQVASSKMDELKKLGELKAAGVLTEEEFQQEKAKLLNS
ncbi:SHOCT domain-containing protein [Chitinophaga sp. S165]|uniref:SHOCT domain-containing protein n=1 Tax=Chitinophaga sp. S165 TaxID=2135462 RepID=UPI000D868446|nr:SHOCT domain-containing protein [Chitinophaga sp. S165]PWV46521.1 putative oligomerization/nucleic acid binding protein [Chitinophaga sp. S165]